MRRKTLVLTPLLLLALAGPVRAAGAPIMPLGAVTPGASCTAYTVVQGTTVSSFAVAIIDIVTGKAGEDARILVRVSGPAVDATGVAEGFSGSPVYCIDPAGAPRVIGAISETVGDYGQKLALVTPIEQITAEPATPAKPPVAASYRPKLLRSARELRTPIEVTGVSRTVSDMINAAGARAKRRMVAAPVGAVASFPAQPLLPGQSVSVGFAGGDIAAGAIGTVTYADGSVVYAFGHPLDLGGRRRLLLQDAYIYTVVPNPIDQPPTSTSYKLGAPGHDLGIIGNDTPTTVVGTLGTFPPTTVVHIATLNTDTGAKSTIDSHLADEVDVGQPEGSSLLGPFGLIAISQATVLSLRNAVGDQSGSMCATFTVAEVSKPLHFCNRYVVPAGGGGGGSARSTATASRRKPAVKRPAQPKSAAPPGGAGLLGVAGLPGAMASDFGNAVSTLDSVLSVPLHVTKVDLDLKLSNGLPEAYLVDAKAPRSARAGAKIPVTVQLRVTRGPLITRSFTLRVPHGAHGTTTLDLTGTAPDGGSPSAPSPSGQSVTVQLNDMLNSSSSSPSDAGDPGPDPASLPDLFNQIERFDGVSAQFGGKHHKKKKKKSKSGSSSNGAPVFTDPAVRIGGTTSLTIRVHR